MSGLVLALVVAVAGSGKLTVAGRATFALNDPVTSGAKAPLYLRQLERRPKGLLYPSADRNVTFNRDIAPIVFHYCASCHRPGEAGPFPLLTYEDVKKHGNQIAAVTTTRFMPPWLPEPQPLKFADERRLSGEQIALIQKWVEQGMIQGQSRGLAASTAVREGMATGQA